MRGVAEALPFVVVGIFVVIGAVQLLSRSDVYEQIGRGGLSLDDDAPRPAGSGAEREDEIRQMLAARNARRACQGRPALDVESELRRLTRGAAPATGEPAPETADAGSGRPRDVDAELEQEVRDLVIARNARRGRRGQSPLDVETEVQRQLREL